MGAIGLRPATPEADGENGSTGSRPARDTSQEREPAEAATRVPYKIIDPNFGHIGAEGLWMAQSFRVELDRLRALSPELARIAEAAEQELTKLETSLAAEGECWGNDEPGRMFGESYEPQAKDGMAAFRTVVDNLRLLNTGITEAADTFERQDTDAGRLVQNPAYPGANGEWPVPTMSPAPSAPVPTTPLTPTDESPAYPTVAPTSNTAPIETAGLPSSQASGHPSSPASGTAPTDTATAPDSPEQIAGRPDTAAPGSVPAPADSGEDRYAPATPVPAGPAAPTAADRPGTPRSTPPAGPTAGPTTAPDRPWSRQPGAAGSNPLGPPWRRDAAPAGSPRGQVFTPTAVGPPPPADSRKPEKPQRDSGGKRKKSVSVRAKDLPVPTDPAALAAAWELADRHGLRLIGFESSGIGEHTVHEIAAAVDDIVGKYPFAELAGIEIAVLPKGRISQVRRESAAKPGTATGWISLQRRAIANPEYIADKVRAATRSARIVPGAEERPVYSTVVRDLGRLLEERAGPTTRRLVQQALITEYRRISGPWDGDTLASVVRGYRQWRAQLSRGCFTRDRLNPRAALIEGFTEVELRAQEARGPAKVLHRLLVERARGRSDA